MKIRKKSAAVVMALAKLLDQPQLNKSLCLIFNAVATINAITFIVLFIQGKTNPLLAVGIVGCILMTLANITDNIPSFLSRVAKRISKT